MAGTGSVGFNSAHLQFAEKESLATATWVDIPGFSEWDPRVNTDSTDIAADGGTYETVFGATRGEGTVTAVDMNPTVMAGTNGGTVITDTSGGIDTVDLAGQYVAPPIMLSDWVPNVGQKNNPDVAGLRTVLLNASLSPWRRSAGQGTTHNWTTDLRFSGTDEEPTIRYQWLQAAPTFTDGVMDVPAPSTD